MQLQITGAIFLCGIFLIFSVFFGDCDSDADCDDDLVCYQLNEGDTGPEDCFGIPFMDVDYCGEPGGSGKTMYVKETAILMLIVKMILFVIIVIILVIQDRLVELVHHSIFGIFVGTQLIEGSYFSKISVIVLKLLLTLFLFYKW